MTNYIAQNELLFQIIYQILLNKEQGYLSAVQLASHYKQKIKRNINKKSSDERGEETLNAEAILLMIKQESMKSSIASFTVIGTKIITQLKNQGVLIPFNIIGLYYLRLRMVMGIACLCNLDLNDENVYKRLFQIMKKIDCNKALAHSLSLILLKGLSAIMVARLLAYRFPWFLGVSVLSTLTADGIVTYKLGQKAYCEIGLFCGHNSIIN